MVVGVSRLTTASNPLTANWGCRMEREGTQKGKCAVSGEWFLQLDSIVCHMKVPKEQGGQERYSNLVLLHRRYLPLLTDQDTAALKSICKQLTVTRKQPVSYTHLDVYKRQLFFSSSYFFTSHSLNSAGYGT